MERRIHLMKNEDILTVKDILKRPLFLHAKLIAGKKGISRKIDWVHILDITTVAPFTNQNNLILTTGLGFQKKTANRKKYMLELIEKGATALCVELGEHLPKLPQDMIDIANQHNFPVFIFDKPIRFVDITQDIHSLLINRKYQLLNDLELFSRKLQQLTLQSTDVTAVLRLLHEYTSYQVIYSSLLEKDKFFPSVSPEMSQDLCEHYKFELEKQPSETQETITISIHNRRFIYFQPIICLGQTLSYVGVILHNQNTTESIYLRRILEYVSKAVAHILLRKLYLKEKTLENHQELIRDILENTISNEDQARTRIGLSPFHKGHYLFIAGIIDIKHDLMDDKLEDLESKNQDLLVSLRTILKKQGLYSLMMKKNNHLYLLCIQEAFSEASTSKFMKDALLKASEQLQKYITHTFEKGVTMVIGFGQIKHRIVDTTQSFKEAFDTLEVTRLLPSITSPFYEDLGIFQLLKGISDKQLLSTFIRNHLGSIIQYDNENHSNLLKTLDEYLKCMGAKQETAERLFIHRQTLYHRLEKLESLLGSNFLQPEKRLCLELALRAYDIV